MNTARVSKSSKGSSMSVTAAVNSSRACWRFPAELPAEVTKTFPAAFASRNSLASQSSSSVRPSCGPSELPTL